MYKNRQFIRGYYIEFPIRIRGFLSKIRDFFGPKMLQVRNLPWWLPQRLAFHLWPFAGGLPLGALDKKSRISVGKNAYSNRKVVIIDLNNWFI